MKLSDMLKQAAIRIQRAFRVFRLKRRNHWLSLLYRIQSLRASAATSIQKFIKGWRVRKEFAQLKSPLTIVWKKGGNEVFIAGTFTRTHWAKQIPLVYLGSLGIHYTAHLSRKRLEPGRYHFKFIVDGVWVCDHSQAVSQDFQGNFNNRVSVTLSSRNFVRPASVHSLTKKSTSKMIISLDESCSTVPTRAMSGTLNSPLALAFNFQEAKGQRVSLVFGAYMASHNSVQNAPPTQEGSADAYFYDKELSAFGVADGVGDWETYGLDPSLFSKELIRNCYKHFKREKKNIEMSSDFDMGQILDTILYESYNEVSSYGSSTIMIGVCKGTYLHTVLLGDSGLMVLRYRDTWHRQLRVAYKSEEQQHSFNCPYQLARLPSPEDYDRLQKQGLGSLVSLLKHANRNSQDTPFDARPEMISLRPGDILICATDGLFDNLYENDILRVCESHQQYEGKKFCSMVAKELVEFAIDKGWDSSYRSPFSRNAMKVGKRYIGGKLDDTTVVVAIAESI